MRRFGFPTRNLVILLAAGVALGGCASYYGGYGGRGGYGGLSVGIGTGSYYDPYYGSYYSPYYNRLGYYGGNPYWGWNDGFYYPGTGYYVYDRYRRPYRWTSSQQRYWTQRRAAIGTTATSTTAVTTSTKVRPNWSGFSRAKATQTSARAERQQRIESRTERRQSKSGAGTPTERSRRARQPD